MIWKLILFLQCLGIHIPFYTFPCFLPITKCQFQHAVPFSSFPYQTICQVLASLLLFVSLAFPKPHLPPDVRNNHCITCPIMWQGKHLKFCIVLPRARLPTCVYLVTWCTATPWQCCWRVFQETFCDRYWHLLPSKHWLEFSNEFLFSDMH